MVKDSNVLTIDIGSDSLKLAEFSVDTGDALVLNSFAFAKLENPSEKDGDDSGVVSDRLKAEIFRQTLKKLLDGNNFTAKRVRISLSAGSAFLRLSRLPDALGSRDAIDKVVEYEAQQAVPCAMSEVEWDYQLIHHKWLETVEEPDDNGKITEVQVDREEYEALFAAVRREQITMYTDIIEDFGFEIVSVTIAPVALFNAAKVTQLADYDECSIILNIGAGSSSLIISDQERLFIRSIPTAADAITAQIAREFDVSLPEAEELKRRHGFVSLGGAYDDPDSEMAATISKIARNIMTRLHGEISRSINVWRAQYGGRQPKKLLLAGGGSVMPCETDFFQEKLRIPVEYLNTFGAISVAEGVDREKLQSVAPMFQEMIGLGLHEIIECPVDIVLLPREIRRQQALDRQKPYFLAAAGVMILCLLIFGFGMLKLQIYSETLVDNVKAELVKTEGVQRQVTSLMRQCNETRDAYEGTLKVLDARKTWINLMNDIEKLTPDMMWITSIEGVDSRNESDTKKSVGNMTLANIAAQNEIDTLVISGYTLIYKKDSYVYSNFHKNLEESGLFAEVKDIRTFDSSELGGGNMTEFVCAVRLKEPIRK